MTRINVFSNDGAARLGWFDLDTAEVVQIEGTQWDGHNMRGVISGLQTTTAALYRTKGGRWVENVDARREGGTETWRFLTDTQARNWIIASGADDAEDNLAKWFPETPDEEGPAPQGGRPAIGPTINVAYPRDLLDKIEAAAKEAGMSRAAWLRKVAEDAVSSL